MHESWLLLLSLAAPDSTPAALGVGADAAAGAAAHMPPTPSPDVQSLRYIVRHFCACAALQSRQQSRKRLKIKKMGPTPQDIVFAASC